MTAYIALLRAVNVGGTGKLPMADLKRLAEDAGFAAVRTYIASGNLVFESALEEAEVRARLEAALKAYAGKSVGVLVRTGTEMAAVLAANPFSNAAPNRVTAIFLDHTPPADALGRITGRKDEQLGVGPREIYVHYPSGQAATKLRVPAAEAGTARNMNTVAILTEMAAAM